MFSSPSAKDCFKRERLCFSRFLSSNKQSGIRRRIKLIKNLELILENIDGFSFTDIKCLTNFNLSFIKDFNIYRSLLDIDFIVESNNESFLVQFRFREPQNIKFESLGYFQPVDLAIRDLSSKGWENIKYEIQENENNTLSFYCNEIEVVSISKTNLMLN